MDNNEIETLEKYSFSSLNKIRKLKLNSNKIEVLDEAVFSYLNSLEDLDLSSNRISCLQKSLFVDLTSLRYLDLSNNRIGKIESFTFKNLFKLVSLNISVNDADLSIEKYGMVGLSSLKTLNLSVSVLTRCSQVKFSIKDDLKDLRLYKQIGNRRFYESVDIIGEKSFKGVDDEVYKSVECHLILFFIRYNILFNLNNENDVYVFNQNCLNLKIDFSFF